MPALASVRTMWIACLTTGILAGSLAPMAAVAQPSGLAGNWAGTGRIILTTGDAERARCRATIRQSATRTFEVSAVCATASARIAQTARVQQISRSGYEGRFYNREYDITGNIQITQRGNRLSARLVGGGATGTLSLRR